MNPINQREYYIELKVNSILQKEIPEIKEELNEIKKLIEEIKNERN